MTVLFGHWALLRIDVTSGKGHASQLWLMACTGMHTGRPEQALLLQGKSGNQCDCVIRHGLRWQRCWRPKQALLLQGNPSNQCEGVRHPCAVPNGGIRQDGHPHNRHAGLLIDDRAARAGQGRAPICARSKQWCAAARTFKTSPGFAADFAPLTGCPAGSHISPGYAINSD